MRLRLFLLCISLILQGCQRPRPSLDEHACAPLSPGALALEGVESQEGYDAELDAIDLDALPASLSLQPLQPQEQVLVRYMLDVRDGDAFDTAALRASGPLAHAVLGSFGRGGGGAVDFAFLRRGLHRFYACDRGFPLTLTAFFDEVSDFRPEAPTQTVDSSVKGLPRRIRRNGDIGTFVAETLLGGVVRETEIILTDRRNDGAIDFLEYDDDGKLRSASSFLNTDGAESTGAAPFTCLGCHSTHDVSPPP